MEYKSDNNLDLSQLEISLEKPSIETHPETFNERDYDLLNHLAQVFNELSQSDDQENLLDNLISSTQYITYNIDDLLSDIDAFSSFEMILTTSTNVSLKSKCLAVIINIAKYSNYPLTYFFQNANLLVDLINYPETMDQTLHIFHKIIHYDNEYTFAIITKTGLLPECCNVFLNIDDFIERGKLLNFIYYILSKTNSATFHEYYEGKEVINIPLHAIKEAILNDFELTKSFSVFNIIADNWTSNFRSLFDQQFTQKCITIWNRSFPSVDDIPLCEEIIKLLNKLIYLFPDEFIMFRIYDPIIKTLLELSNRDETFPHMKILFLCSNIAARYESGNALVNSGLFSIYEERYELMSAMMKENFLFIFGNLILSKVIQFDENEKTIYYFTEMLDNGKAKCSNSFQRLILKILSEFREEIINFADPEDINEFITTMSEKESTNDDLLENLTELNNFYFPQE